MGFIVLAVGGSITGKFLGESQANNEGPAIDRAPDTKLNFERYNARIIGNASVAGTNASALKNNPLRANNSSNQTNKSRAASGTSSLFTYSGGGGSEGGSGGNSGSSPSSNAPITIQSGESPLDLEIMDQDEPYRDGVTATWTATDAKPGNSYDFFESFVQMRETVISMTPPANHTEISADYSVTESNPCPESSTDCHTDQHPDTMAKEMLITRCIYRGDAFCIDCLSGKKLSGYDSTSHLCSGSVLETSSDWKINDTDTDGKISFYDLKNRKLDNLPPVTMLMTPRFEMGIKFSEDAGNDFQGDIFNLTMTFKLNQDASQ